MKTRDPTLKPTVNNLRLVMAESSITAGLLAMSVLTPFFNSIGLNQTQISETQMMFMVITILFNLPLGYIADRFSAEYIMRNAGLEEEQAGSRLLGEISITSDMQMTPLLRQKVKKN